MAGIGEVKQEEGWTEVELGGEAGEREASASASGSAGKDGGAAARSYSHQGASFLHFLTKESIVADPTTYNRWFFPPAALMIHLSIGQSYAYSVFNKPLIKQLCEGDCDLIQIGWVFTLFFVFLGSSAAVFGRRLEILGPRFAGNNLSILS